MSSLPPNEVLTLPTKNRKASKYSRKGYEENGTAHVTGCARSEGYYKIAMRDKVKYLPHHKENLFATHTDSSTKSHQKTQVMVVCLGSTLIFNRVISKS